ncbi:MAG: TolC family protein [Elusimicrobia bacterium]|nr:TolC family protein [Elusimicrobiota bacterium]
MLLSVLAATLLMPRHACAETLTLRGAMSEAILRSAEVASAQARAAELGLEEPLLLADTDPRFEAALERADDRSPRALPLFEGSRARVDRWSGGLAANTLLGTQARLRFENERLLSPTPFRLLDPSVESRLALEVRQPLLRYLWGRPDKARRGRFRSAALAAELRLRDARERAAQSAAKAFVELYFAQRQRAVKSDGVDDARRLLAKYEEKRRYGLAEESDLLQAKASLEVQETELLLADAQLARARHALAAALFRPASEPDAVSLEGAPPEAAGLEDEALERRADVASSLNELRAREWEERIARLDALPEVSLNAAYTFAGLATRYGPAIGDMASWDHPVAAAGVSLAVPIGFKKERLTRRQAGLRTDAARAEVERARTWGRRELRDARETLALARRRLAAGSRLLELERKKFAAEESNFRRGRSSTDLLLRFQQDIRRAEIELRRAEADEVAALVELARAAGTLLAP